MKLLGLIKISTLHVVYFYRPRSRCKGNERRHEGLRERNVKKRPSEARVKALRMIIGSIWDSWELCNFYRTYSWRVKGARFLLLDLERRGKDVMLTWPTPAQLLNNKLISLFTTTCLRRFWSRLKWVESGDG